MIRGLQILENAKDAPTAPPAPYRPLHDLRLTRQPRTRPALVLSTLLVLMALWWTPDALLRLLFGSGQAPETPIVTARDPFEQALRLIPAPRVQNPAPPTSETRPIRERLAPRPVAEVEPAPDTASALSADDAWTWDPTSTYSLHADLLAPRSPAAVDTIARRAELLRRLTLSDLRYLQPTDTTQVDLAWRQWREVDDWVNRVYGPLWRAQGFSARLSDLYERAFIEAEREGQ